MSGTTGSGKSLILETLQQRGEQVWEKNNKKLHFAFLEEKKWIQSRFLNGSLDRKPSLQGLCLFFSPLDDPFGVVSSA